MKVSRKYKYIVAIAVLLALSAAGLWFTLLPRQFVLIVNNNSTVPVEQLRLFGSALSNELLLANIAPGQSYSIELPLAATGDLRYEVKQGLTRADALISSDVAALETEQQQLTIYPQHRFILSRTEP